MKSVLSLSHPVIKELYGQNLFEYLLVANPDDIVHEKIKAETGFFSNNNVQKISEPEPHITVATFFAKESMEETLTRWLQRICTQQQRFAVTLNNYSGFPPHTIYLRVQNEEPFKKFAKSLLVLNEYISSCACPPLNIISKPHLSISAKLKEDFYFKALTQYAHKSFHETFIVNELLLLKRKQDYEEYKKINVFGLAPEELSCLTN